MQKATTCNALRGIVLGLGLFIFLTSCSKDEADSYIALHIETNADSISVYPGISFFINILENDLNITENSVLEIESPSIGTLTVNDNDTPNNLLDDTLWYEINENFIGTVEVGYTICNDNSCDSATISINVQHSTVINIAPNFMPHDALSSYNFFIGPLSDLTPNLKITPYEPTSSLFSDYALKKRFVYVPEGLQASYEGDGEPLNLPIGSILIKTFYYENVLPQKNTLIIETRLMFHTPNGWTFAEYIWNQEQTEAYLDTDEDGGFLPLSWLQNGEEKSLNYRMPSVSECITCHKKNFQNAPIGIKPQNLNTDYLFKEGEMNQLAKWQSLGILENNLPPSIVSLVDYTDTNESLDLRVRSYFDVNCASCHSDEGHCDYRSMRFAFDENHLAANLGICITPDDELPLLDNQKIIKPNDPENSVLYIRVSTNQENLRMPLLGRRMEHEEGIQLIEDWIMSLEENCN